MLGFDKQHLHSCKLTAKQLETDTQLNTKLGFSYIEYCDKNFPASEARAIACHKFGVPMTKSMPVAKLKKLEAKGGYVWKVLQAEKQLRAIKQDRE